MRWRTFVFTIFLLPSISLSEPAAPSRIAILTDLVNAIGAAGDAISKLTAGFKTLVVAGKDSYEYVAAERERSRLIVISRRTAHLIVSQNASVVESIDDYLTLSNPDQQDWSRVIGNLESTLKSVQALLTDVQHEDGSFVLEPAYLSLNKLLSSRASILSNLASMPVPKSKQELKLLRVASGKYKILIARAEEAVKQLNSYVKGKK